MPPAEIPEWLKVEDYKCVKKQKPTAIIPKKELTINILIIFRTI